MHDSGHFENIYWNRNRTVFKGSRESSPYTTLGSCWDWSWAKPWIWLTKVRFQHWKKELTKKYWRTEIRSYEIQSVVVFHNGNKSIFWFDKLNWACQQLPAWNCDWLIEHFAGINSEWKICIKVMPPKSPISVKEARLKFESDLLKVFLSMIWSYEIHRWAR